MSDNPTPDAMRALIAELRSLAHPEFSLSVPNWVKEPLSRAVAALEASLPREAEGWEYGAKGLHGEVGRHVSEGSARWTAKKCSQPYYRRRPAGPWEPVPPTHEG